MVFKDKANGGGEIMGAITWFHIELRCDDPKHKPKNYPGEPDYVDGSTDNKIDAYHKAIAAGWKFYFPNGQEMGLPDARRVIGDDKLCICPVCAERGKG